MNAGCFPTFLTRADALEREWFESELSAYGVPQGSNYAAVLPRSDNGYVYYLLRYLLMSPDGTSIEVTDPAQMDDIGSRQYLFVYSKDNKIVNEWIKAHYPDQVGNDVIVLRNGVWR